MERDFAIRLFQGEAKRPWLRGEAMKMNASFNFVGLRIVIGMREFL